jgi:hypothetical protein
MFYPPFPYMYPMPLAPAPRRKRHLRVKSVVLKKASSKKVSRNRFSEGDKLLIAADTLKKAGFKIYR